MKTRLQLFILLFVVILLGCGSTSVNKKTFSYADLQGSWELIHFGKLAGIFGSYGSIDIGPSGTVSGGIVNNFGVDIQKFTGGIINILSDGFITGDINAFLPDSNTNEKIAIYKGKMSSNKEIIVYSASFNLGRKGIGVLIKKGGEFSQNDLNNIWIFPMEGLFTISVDNLPDIASCSYILPSGDTLQCYGELNLSSSGNITGKLQFVNNRPFTADLNGRLNLYKDVMILAGGISTRFEGISTLAIKKVKEFSPDSLKGNWSIFIPSDADTIYGTLEINNAGIIKGDWADSKKERGVFTGEIKITDNEHENISGTINLSHYISYSILGGVINSSEDIISLYAKDKTGTPMMILMMRT